MKRVNEGFLANSGAPLVGLEEIIFAVVSGYPGKDVWADILKDGKCYSFELMKSSPSSLNDKSSSTPNHVGYLFSKHLKSSFHADFERSLQPSVYDLRSMYESGEPVRAFVATNGSGWAFRLFDFQDASLAESDWLESGFINATRSAKDIESFVERVPIRMALGMLRKDERVIRLLVSESRIIGARTGRLQVSYEMIPSEVLARLLLIGGCVVILGETFLQADELRSDEIFEHHLVEAFNAIKRDDTKSAFEEVLKFSLPSVNALAGSEGGETRIRKIKEINSRLHELRLPIVPETRKLNALVGFLENIHECAYSLLVQGHRKTRDRLNETPKLNEMRIPSMSQSSSGQPASEENYAFDGVIEFMNEAIRSYPNVMVGRIKRHSEARNRYLITDFRVLPCDVAIRYSPEIVAKNGLSEASGSGSLVGRTVSRLCCSEHEMLTLLHPDTRTLNEMLRVGDSLNAVAVTNGEKCLFRLHDGSDNTLMSVHTA